ncbi:MAG: hypothetical protein IPH99_04145 [Xanthomonadales bacterium]|nr:hypothetical protein [Xanthomonadales bacterium]
MALSENQLRAIARQARAFWDAQVSNKGFLEITRGKEIGHRIADYVDDHTTALLKVKFDTRYEADGKGESRKRSMGDVVAWGRCPQSRQRESRFAGHERTTESGVDAEAFGLHPSQMDRQLLPLDREVLFG